MKKLIILLMLLIGNAVANPIILQAKYKNIIVNGKQIKVMTIEQPDGTWGYYAKSGESFNVIVQNKLDQSTTIHWHGLILPNSQDGSEVTQKLITPSEQYNYNFELKNTGTFWMHSHNGLQLQNMLAAPLIIEDVNDYKYQQVVIVFQDYIQESASKVLRKLQSSTNDSHNMHEMSDMDEMEMDLNDVKYNAYLTNYHDNESPQITQIKPNSQVKLRFINAASASNFWINLGKLKGTLVAVDGESIIPIIDNKFQLAMGQRADIIINIPKSGGTFPILGQVEGLTKQTGIILSTEINTKQLKINNDAKQVIKALDYSQEYKLHSVKTKAFTKPDKVYKFTLNGDMDKYVWTINNQAWPNITPQIIKYGEKVQFEFNNQTMMSHPIHLHGYTFKIVSINGKTINGALRDTVLVMPHSKVKIEFTANNNGKWVLHCHTLYHMHTGMMTYINVVPDK